MILKSSFSELEMKHYWLCLQSHIRSPCKSGGTIEDVALFGFLFMSERQQSITTSNMTVGVQVMPPEKMPFGYFNYLELQALEKQQMREKLPPNSLTCLNTDPPKKSSMKVSPFPGRFKSRSGCHTQTSLVQLAYFSKGPFVIFHCY